VTSSGAKLAPLAADGLATVAGVASVQIKNVPDDIRLELHRRAHLAGQSLQEFLLARLVEIADTPSLDEVLERAGRHRGKGVPLDVIVATIRGDRESR